MINLIHNWPMPDLILGSSLGLGLSDDPLGGPSVGQLGGPSIGLLGGPSIGLLGGPLRISGLGRMTYYFLLKKYRCVTIEYHRATTLIPSHSALLYGDFIFG